MQKKNNLSKLNTGTIVIIILFILLPVIAFYCGRKYEYALSKSKLQLTPVVQTTDTSEPEFTPDITPVAGLDKTYIAKNYAFKFHYPSNWIADDYPGYETSETEFFLAGTIPDHGFGDHVGNEVMAVEYGKDNRSLEEMRNTYYPNAQLITINGKDALEVPSGTVIIKLNKNESVTFPIGSQNSDIVSKILKTITFKK